MTVGRDHSVGRFIKPQQKLGYSGFTTACSAGDPYHLTSLQAEINIRKRLILGVFMAEGDMVKCDFFLEMKACGITGRNFRFSLEEFVDAFLRGGSTLHNSGNPAQGRYRPGKHIYI